MKTISTPILHQKTEFAQAEAYTYTLVADYDAAVTFQTFDDNSERKLQELAKTRHDTLANAWDWLQKQSDAGAGVFVTVQETDGSGKRTEANITRVRALIIDCDNGLPEQWHLEPTMVVESSPNKGHAYWVLSEPLAMAKEEYVAATNRLISFYNADVACKDLARVLRLPGFTNRKPAYNNPLVTMVSKSDKRYELAEVLANVPELPTATKQTYKSKANQLSASDETLSNCFAHVIPANSNLAETLAAFANKLRQAQPGERNSTLNKCKYTLAGAYPNNIGEIDEALTIAALDIGLSGAEIRATLASANAGANKPIALQARIGSTNVNDAITLVGNSSKRSKSNQMRETLDSYFGRELQWDEMQNKLRWRGQHLSMEKLHDICERELDIDLPWDNFRRIASVKAQERPYHAARAYLQSLSIPNNAYDAEPVLSALYQAMGVMSCLHRMYIRKWLIAAVSRAMVPGGKADTALVLQGRQGIGKTTFFDALFGDFFQTLGEHKNDVDQLLSMIRSWCIEWGEIENAFSRKAVAAIKSFMTIEKDTYRRPYASEPETIARHFVICGTTNQSEFLVDSTGNRRFWVVNIEQQIDTAEVALMRDEVWAAVLRLYLDGEQYWLTETEAKASAEDTAQYEQESPWVDKITAYLSHHNPCTLADILEHALGFDISKLNDKKAQAEVTSILRKLGCEKKQQRINGVKAIYWHKPTLDSIYTKDITTTTVNIPAEEYIDTDVF